MLDSQGDVSISCKNGQTWGGEGGGVLGRGPGGHIQQLS
jgi:hypothetical protein